MITQQKSIELSTTSIIDPNFEWFSNAKIYQVFTDRFAGYKQNYTEEELKKGLIYGNLKALINKLDYIKSLNFNMIWISPFFVNQPNGYHGYHPVNHNHVDPRFAYGEAIIDPEQGDLNKENDMELKTGADSILEDLINEVHKRDMKIMMDMVPNHVHNTMPFYEQSYKDFNNKYHLWFCFKDHNKENIEKQKFNEEKIIRKEKRKKENKARKKTEKELRKKYTNEGNEEELAKLDKEKKANKAKFYEESKKKFLEDHPNKTETDFIEIYLKNESKRDEKKQKKKAEKNLKKEGNEINTNENDSSDSSDYSSGLEFEETPCHFMHFLGFDELIKLNLDFEPCGNYMIKVTKKWVKMGFDAVRIDHCTGPSMKFLKKLTDEVHKDFPKVPIIGECLPFSSAAWSETLLSCKKDQLEKVLNQSYDSLVALDEMFMEYVGNLDGLIDFVYQGYLNNLCDGKITEDAFENLLKIHYDKYQDKKFILMRVFDSHDCERGLFKCGQNRTKFQSILKKLFKGFKGRNDPFVMYYGTEDYMTQLADNNSQEYGDWACRQPMQFNYEFMRKLMGNE